jgi:serine O-acetyltransferase
MNLGSLMAADIRAKANWLYGRDDRSAQLSALVTDGTFAMLVYRLMQAAQRQRLTPLAMLFNKLNVICGGCIIGRGARFGPRFVLIHSQGVVINTAVSGGSDIRIEQQVTIGAERGRSPRLGDDVFIGAGAKLIGGITVGSHVKIGANAVVVDDIPDGTTAVGIPARPLTPGAA